MGESLKRMSESLKRMGETLKSGVVGRAVTPSHTAADDNGGYEVMTSPTTSPVTSPTPVDEIYEPVEPIPQQPAEDPEGYLIPAYPPRPLEGGRQPSNGSQHYRVPVYPPRPRESGKSSSKKNKDGHQAEAANIESSRTGVISIYEDLWEYKKENNAQAKYDPTSYTDPIYDEVESQIAASIPGTKIIPVEEPPSAYDEVIINDGRYMIPSRQWDSDSDAMESDFDEDTDAPNYFGDNLEQIYENLENRKLTSPIPKTIPFNAAHDEEQQTMKSPARLGVLGNCLPVSFTKSSKTSETSSGHDDEEAPLYVDPNNLGEKEPVMPPLSLELSTEEAERYEIVNKILETEATYKESLSQLVQIEQDSRDRQLLETENLDVIFCSLQSILQTHEMFSMVLAARMNEWTVEGKLGDIICATFTKSTTTMAYIDFVNNFLAAIDTFRAACKSNSTFSQYVQAKVNCLKPKTSFHDLMLKPFERFSEFIRLIQDLLEVTAVSHVDRVPLQLALTQLECIAELINSRRKESEMKSQLKYLDTQISQLKKPLSSSGRVFIRQDDMIHCLIDGVSVVETKKLRLVLLSDMLLCLSPVGKKKRIVQGLLNAPKYKFKLKWNVPLSDVEFVEYGTGVSVAAGKYGTTTTYTDRGKYRQATMEIQKHIENLQHDLAVIGQIAGLVSSLRGKHQLLDQHKVEQWHKSVENTIIEEMKTVNMFWLELSLPTKSGQHNYVFNLPSPTVKEEWQADATNAKLALESRNNPGWYLPEDDITGGLSILRRNMPLLAEFFDLFLFNARSTVEHTITYPVENSNIPSSMTARGLGYYVWISARGEMQGHVSVLRFERNACVPRFVESFHVCPGTVYSMAHIPAMNTRSDQSADKYHTKYGFPFPTVWLGSHSSKVYIYDAKSDDRSRPLMELKLRDAPLAMKFASRKVYVGLANGTLAIFRSNTSGHWNLVQPSILPLGRFPVAVIADVKDNLWCSSGSQIYVVSKKGDRIQRIIAVDSNMKNLVKHVVSCGVGVWVSVWKKATIKLYHAETCEMVQEVNVVSPVVKMRNDVDSQVQYLSVDKISVTALLFIPGFLWVGTSVGLILLYPLPKMQGVPRVVGRACVAFHAHCGPVRSLLAIPQGVVAEESKSDDVSAGDEDPNEINRKFSMLADSEESVASDEDFYFVDDNKPSPKKKKSSSSGTKHDPRRVKVSVKSAQQASVRSAATELPSNENSGGFGITKPDDFARMMETFDGFNQDSSSKKEKTRERSVRSFRNKLFVATCAQVSQEKGNPPDVEEFPMLDTNKMHGTNAPSGSREGETKPSEKCSEKESTDLSTSDMKSGVLQDFHSEKSPASNKSAGATGNTIDDNSPALTFVDRNVNVVEKNQSCTDEQNIECGTIPVDGTKGFATAGNPSEDTKHGNSSTLASSDGNKNAIEEPHKDTDEPSIYVNIPVEKSKDLAKSSLTSKDTSKEDLITSKQKRCFQKADENATSSRNSVRASTCSEADQQPKRDNDLTSSEGGRTGSSSSRPGGEPPATSSCSSNPLEKSSETYITVLPTTLEKEFDGNTEADNGVIAAEGDIATEPDSWLSKTGKSRSKCLSYVVVSGGEGHVDLRLKVKSKQDLKKDGQSMLLIWRVNSKV